MQFFREQSAADQERFERKIAQLEEKNENITDWFNSRVQQLEMNTSTLQEELRMSQQQLKDSELERKLRIKSMISSRGLDDNAGAARYSEHSAVDDMEHCTADKLIEDHLDREQQLDR